MSLDGKDYFVLKLSESEYQSVVEHLASKPNKVELQLARALRALTDYTIETDGPIQELQDVLAMIAPIDGGATEA